MKKLLFMAVAACVACTACNSNASDNAGGQSADTTEVAADTVARANQADTAALVAEVADAVVEVQPGESPEAADGMPAVIDFSAVWCGPCQKFKPIYHKVAGEYAGKAKFYSADLDNLKELADKYKITSIPCVVILKKGAEPVATVGYMEEAEFKTLLDKNL